MRARVRLVWISGDRICSDLGTQRTSDLVRAVNRQLEISARGFVDPVFLALCGRLLSWKKIKTESRITRRALSLRVIRLQMQFCVELALVNWWPGGIVSKDFSKFSNSFRMRLPHPIRAFKKLSNNPGPVSGYAFSAEKDLPIHSVMCTKFSGKRPPVKSKRYLGGPVGSSHILTGTFAH